MPKKLTDERKAERKARQEAKAEERMRTALEMAKKDGREWDGLDDIMKNAYLHNADVAISQRGQPQQD